MATKTRIRLAALTALLCGCPPAIADTINGNFLFLTDSAPAIYFEDNDTGVFPDWQILGVDNQLFVFGESGEKFIEFNQIIDSATFGSGATANTLSSLALGSQASTAGEFSVALGYSAYSQGNNTLALGRDAYTSSSNALALGREANASAGAATAVGYSAFATATSSIALGYLSQAGALSSAALGHFAGATGPYSTALGYFSKAIGEGSTAVGANAYADQPGTVVLGSIPGVNSGSAYANVGMGTNTPSEAVEVQRSAAAARFQLTSFTATASEAPQFIQRRARGTSAAPAAVQNGDNLGLFSFRGYNGATMGGSRATITAQAAGNFTGASTPTRLTFATTPVGQTVPQQVLVITPDGKVQVNGQNLTVPDYVFEDDYELMPLDDLRSFINENGHLPGIPSAGEVNAGVHDLAGSDMAHLRKIEELTLYTLQQQEQLVTQQEHLHAQQLRIEQLETQLKRVLAALD